MKDEENIGRITRIAGPVVGAAGLQNIQLQDVVLVGQEKLIGEVIKLIDENVIIQVYEDTSGVCIGEPVSSTGNPLVATLGPGLLGQIYDGLQRPLMDIAKNQGNFIHRGTSSLPLPMGKNWSFTPRINNGQLVSPGEIIGDVPESAHILHQILVPPRMKGRILEIKTGEFNINQPIAILEKESGQQIELKLNHTWPIRNPRPIHKRVPPEEPLQTGTRIIDLLFPIAKGGSAIIPGGFGTGKTVTQHALSRWTNVDIVVYIGCGERGNEMAEVLEEFPKLVDPYTGAALMERTILIANTSNMPVAAREASIYTGMTIAEYYRDMGYDVLILADSTSRWGEALREISSRLEEIPGEEGFPAYMAARIANFYERTGRVSLPNHNSDDHQTMHGSVSLVGAISPPGGDFSEPITQSSMRVTGCFWALDYDLSRRRHFPAINWLKSYSLYEFKKWYQTEITTDWPQMISDIQTLLRKEDDLLKIVQLVGKDTLSEPDRITLLTARLLREDLLQQNAFHETDHFCPLEKGYWMMKVILTFHEEAKTALTRGLNMDVITQLPVIHQIGRMKEIPHDTAVSKLKDLIKKIKMNFHETG
ncbi:MAG: V-type ATP synthase subunit A [Anaerolineaceae bacterium]|nr:V-type ATP synthase subunit A [Anaerolineaceae bacterium]